MSNNISKFSAVFTAVTKGYDAVISATKKMTDKINNVSRGFNSKQRNDMLDHIQKQNAASNRIYEKHLKQQKNAQNKMSNGWKAAAVAIAGIGATFGIDKIVKYALESVDAMAQLERVARNLDINTAQLERFQYIVRNFHGDIEGATKGFQFYVDTLNDAKQFDFRAIQRINLAEGGAIGREINTDLDFLTALSNISRINDETERNVKLIQRFGDNALDMVFLIGRTQEEQKTFVDRFKSFAVGADDKTIYRVRELQNSINDAFLIYKGIGRDFLQEGAKYLALFLNEFDGILGNAGGNQGKAKQIIDTLISGGLKFLNVLLDIASTIADIADGIASFGRAITRTILLFEGVEIKPFGKIGLPDQYKTAINTIQDVLTGISEKSRTISANLEKSKFDVAATMQAIQVGAAIQDNAMLAPVLKMIQAYKDMHKAQKLVEEGFEIHVKNSSQYEKTITYMQRLQLMQKMNALGEREFGQAILDNLLALEQYYGVYDTRLPTALEKSSSAALSAINEFNTLGNRIPDSPQERLQRALDRGFELDKERNTELKKIAQAATNGIQKVARAR